MQFRLSAYLNICGVNPKEHSVKQELVNPFLTINYLNFLIPFNGSFVSGHWTDTFLTLESYVSFIPFAGQDQKLYGQSKEHTGCSQGP